MEKKIVKINFKSKADFRNRFPGFWLSQKPDEEYEFTFSDKETENDFFSIIKCFKEISEDPLTSKQCN
jgi:hypothetical protein